MECPRCHQSQPAERSTCSACGVIFAKWEEHQQRIKERPTWSERRPDTIGLSSVNPILADCVTWLDQSGRWASMLLLLGFVWPLYKTSLLAAESVMIWPWNLFGHATSPIMVAALATPSGQEEFFPWLMVVLIAGVVSWLLRYVSVPLVRTILMASVGSVALLLLLVVYYREAEILGLAFTPPTQGAGIVIFAFLLSTAVLVVSNRLRKEYSFSTTLRSMAGISGLILGGVVILAAVGGQGPWASWSMTLLYVLLGGQACLALYSALTREVSETVTTMSSRLTRFTIGWNPIAMMIAQETSRDSYLQYAVKAGGGGASTLLAVIKGFCMYFGSAYLMTLGFAGLLTILLAQHMGKEFATDEYEEGD